MRQPGGQVQITLLAIAAGLAVRWSALSGGLRGDDYVQAAMLAGDFPAPRASWDLFRFAGPTAADNAPLLDFGYLAWWSSPELSLAMFRPLASLLVVADHALFGDGFLLFHLHSLLWWAACVWLSGAVLFRFLPAGAAGCALMIFALDEAHNVPVAWLANRSTLVASALGFGALLAHVRARAGGGGPAVALSCAMLALTASAGEYALSVLCYPLAYEALHPCRLSERLRACVPTAAAGGGYLGLRALLDRGVADSGFYLGPFSDPLAFLTATTQRVPAMLADLTFGLPAIHGHTGGPWRRWLYEAGLITPETFRHIPDFRTVQTAIGYLALATLLALLWYGRRGVPAAAGRSLCWLALGAVAGLVPAAAGIPEDRLTVASSLGVSAVLGTALFRAARATWSTGPHIRRLGTALLAIAVLSLHLGLAGLRSHERVSGFAARGPAQRAWALAAELPTDGAAASQVYLLGAADFTTAANLPFVRAYHGLPLPGCYRRLSGSGMAHDITRLADRQLEVLSHGGALPGTMSGSLYRPLDKPLQVGDRLELPGLKIEVAGAWDGNAVRTRYTFDRSLDDPSLWLVHAFGDRLRRVKPPPVGQMQRLPPASGR